MDLRSVSNPAIGSRSEQTNSSKVGPALQGAAGLGGSARTVRLSNSKIQPRFSELVTRFSESPPASNAAAPGFAQTGDHSDDFKVGSGDSLELDSSGASPFKSNHSAKQEATSEVQEKFTEFVGQTLFGSMLASMRKTLGKPAYMHGGRTEEVFQQQLDQLIVEDLTEASADSIASPMFDLFQMQKRS